MQSTLILALLPAIALAGDEKHVRTGHFEPVHMAVKPDGEVGVLKMPNHLEPAAQAEQKEEVVKKSQQVRDEKPEIKEINAAQSLGEDGSHGKKATIAVHSEEEPKVLKHEPEPQKKELEALAKDTKMHQEATPVKDSEVKAHQASKARPKLPEGVSLAQDDPVATEDSKDSTAESEESWKSAFFFFGSLVLMAVLVMTMIGFFYFRRDQAQKADGPETVGLKSTLKPGAQYVNDSSSTSDSGEKIAMLFDRVRQSLEDLSDKTAQQADVAGGQAQGSNTI